MNDLLEAAGRLWGAIPEHLQDPVALAVPEIVPSADRSGTKPFTSPTGRFCARPSMSSASPTVPDAASEPSPTSRSALASVRVPLA